MRKRLRVLLPLLLMLTALPAALASQKEVEFTFNDDNYAAWGLKSAASSAPDAVELTKEGYTLRFVGAGKTVYYSTTRDGIYLGKVGATIEFHDFDFPIAKVEVTAGSFLANNINVNMMVGGDAASTPQLLEVGKTVAFDIAEQYRTASNLVFKLLDDEVSYIAAVKVYGADESASGGVGGEAPTVELLFNAETRSQYGFATGSSSGSSPKTIVHDGLEYKFTGTQSKTVYFSSTNGGIYLGKKDATIEFPEYPFDVARIEISVGNIMQDIPANIYVGGTAVSTETPLKAHTVVGYDIAEGQRSAGTRYVFRLTGDYVSYIAGLKVIGVAAAAEPEPEPFVPVTVYEETFDNDAWKSAFTLIDGDGDGMTWDYNYLNVPFSNTNLSGDTDNWMIAPAQQLEQGIVYEFSVEAWGTFDAEGNRERIALYAGREATAAGMTECLAGPVDLLPAHSVLKGSFTATESGPWYVGVRSTSPKSGFRTFVDNFKLVSATTTAAPAAPGAFLATPQGYQRSAVITLTAPELTLGGEPLTTLSAITLTRNGEAIHTFDNPAPGEALTYTDNVPANGTYRYAATASNVGGTSLEAVSEIYVGVNIAAAPAAVTSAETDILGTVKVVWEPVTQDINGIALDASVVTYALYEKNIIFGSWEEVARNLTATEYTHRAIAADAPQRFAQYAVAAVTEAGEGAKSTHEWLPVGEAYAMPYRESFTPGEYEHITTCNTILGHQTLTGMCMWSLATDGYLSNLTSQDGDGYFALWEGSNKGDVAELFTGKIAVTGENPHITFWYATVHPDNTNELEVMVDCGDGRGFVTQRTVVMGSADGPWLKAFVPVSAFVGKEIRVKWRLVGRASVYGMIDNVHIYDVPAGSVAVRDIIAPAKAKANSDVTVGIVVENLGSDDAADVLVELLRNGEVRHAVTLPHLAAGALETVTFTDRIEVNLDGVSYQGRVTAPVDSDPADNLTEVCELEYVLPGYATVRNLAGSVNDGTVTLTWEEPDAEAVTTEPYTEEFEEYPSFAIDTFGEWTSADGDGSAWSGYDGLTFPGIEPQVTTGAWFVLDSTLPGMNSTFASHSGDKCASTLFNYDGTANDDWLISPLLSGQAQTVSMWVRAYSASGTESFDVYYSTTTPDVSAFTGHLAAQGRNVPAEWTYVEFDLPRGAAYFALRYTSQYQYQLMVDDVTFIPGVNMYAGMQLMGYNVYRDNVKVNDAPLADRTYTDAGAEGAVQYAVSAVWDKGESRLCEPLLVSDMSGLDAPAVDDVRVSAHGNDILVSASAPVEVSVYTPAGVCVYSAPAATSHRVTLPAGIYLVTTPAGTVKTILR